MQMNREEKWLSFKTEDMKENRGLIVNQYAEVQNIMANPKEYAPILEGYLTSLLTYVSRHSKFYQKYENYKRLQDFPIVDKEILKENWEDVFVPEFKYCQLLF
jgi:phenylacetate-CoA ligase